MKLFYASLCLLIVCSIGAVSLRAQEGPIVSPPGDAVAAPFPSVKVACKTRSEIYSNRTARAKDVTVQATDSCKREYSTLRVYDGEGQVVGRPEDISTDQTRTITFTVPAGGKIEFQCDGDEGGCTYSISV